SRATVGSAYETLQRQGYVDRRQGVGTWITGPPHQALQGGKRADAPTLRRDNAAGSDGIISLTMAAATEPPELVLGALGSPTYDWKASLHGHGYHPAGTRELRTAVAQRFEALGVPTSPDEILVTTGAQQAIALVASLLVEP